MHGRSRIKRLLGFLLLTLALRPCWGANASTRGLLLSPLYQWRRPMNHHRRHHRQYSPSVKRIFRPLPTSGSVENFLRRRCDPQSKVSNTASIGTRLPNVPSIAPQRNSEFPSFSPLIKWRTPMTPYHRHATNAARTSTARAIRLSLRNLAQNPNPSVTTARIHHRRAIRTCSRHRPDRTERTALTRWHSPRQASSAVSAQGLTATGTKYRGNGYSDAATSCSRFTIGNQQISTSAACGPLTKCGHANGRSIYTSAARSQRPRRTLQNSSRTYSESHPHDCEPCEPPWSEKELLHKLQDAFKFCFL